MLEAWMIISLLRRLAMGDDSRTPEWYVQHLLWYSVFLATAVCMLVFAVCFLKGIVTNHLPGKIIMICFATVAMAFGINVSYSDYTKGEQILCFVVMAVFVMGLLNWRPWISITISLALFLLFYKMMENAPGIEMSYATQVNFFTVWITLVMVSMAVYLQRLSEAEKDEKLEKASYIDELTGIPNMYQFRRRASAILKNEGFEGKLFLYLDVINFKSFNEKYGFDSGNVLIQELAQNVSIIFKDDLYARYSDDHFVVLTDRKDVETRLKKLNMMSVSMHHDTSLTFKVGSYAPTDVSADPTIACDHARYACSKIKKHFGLNYLEYDKPMDDLFHKRQYIITHLHEAIAEGYIQVYYQPVVWSKDRSLCGAEALARWIDPQYGFLSPADFIPALEEYKLIHHLDRAILEIVCRDLRDSLDHGHNVVPVSFNFSRLDFELTDVKAEVEELAARYDIPAEYLHMEITESALTTSDLQLKHTVQLIQNMGVQLWLDDFGSGYSSLNVLKDYNFDAMKIDMVFLHHFKENEKSKAILSSIMSMADLIHMDTLTEGVETEEQAQYLSEIGCQRLQGYLFGKPMPLDELRDRFGC
ncbi:MAG: EAL domain-containing protein [Eubacterium sp.]|nr:EAL domain-containing protein [Eubacterium sp.]